jgi:RimJ/RimL family protein N-acetyltransferase
MQVFLETPRLVLRRFTLAGTDNLVSLNADPDVMRFLTGGMPAGRDEIENELLPAFPGYYQRSGRYGFWAAIEKRTGEFPGCFYLTPQDGGAPDEVELGFRLRKSAWGKGYAAEGARALIRKGFTAPGVHCIVADTMAVNIASRRVLEKAGLKLARTYHQPGPDPIEGDESGDVEYALHKADWEQQDQAGPGACPPA